MGPAPERAWQTLPFMKRGKPLANYPVHHGQRSVGSCDIQMPARKRIEERAQCVASFIWWARDEAAAREGGVSQFLEHANPDEGEVLTHVGKQVSKPRPSGSAEASLLCRAPPDPVCARTEWYGQGELSKGIFARQISTRRGAFTPTGFHLETVRVPAVASNTWLTPSQVALQKPRPSCPRDLIVFRTQKYTSPERKEELRRQRKLSLHQISKRRHIGSRKEFVAAALTHEHKHVATDSLSSLHQLRRQILYPEKHRHHAQGDVKSHAGTAGNECADRIAKYQASLKDNNLTGTGIPSAGPGGNPFYNIAWLAREEARPSTPESSSHIPILVYFPNLKDALKSYMHAKHKLGYADCKTLHFLPELATSYK
eukprot:1148783-Pelagomonas_calceolata.AAC.4